MHTWISQQLVQCQKTTEYNGQSFKMMVITTKILFENKVCKKKEEKNEIKRLKSLNTFPSCTSYVSKVNDTS